jgi:hypothetical protein
MTCRGAIALDGVAPTDWSGEIRPQAPKLSATATAHAMREVQLALIAPASRQASCAEER